MSSLTPPEKREPSSAAYTEGDRCAVCGYWYWERDGVGWHSLVPITYADHPDRRRMVFCPMHLSTEPPTEADIARGEELAREHGW